MTVDINLKIFLKNNVLNGIKLPEQVFFFIINFLKEKKKLVNLIIVLRIKAKIIKSKIIFISN